MHTTPITPPPHTHTHVCTHGTGRTITSTTRALYNQELHSTLLIMRLRKCHTSMRLSVRLAGWLACIQ